VIVLPVRHHACARPRCDEQRRHPEPQPAVNVPRARVIGGIEEVGGGTWSKNPPHSSKLMKRTFRSLRRPGHRLVHVVHQLLSVADVAVRVIIVASASRFLCVLPVDERHLRSCPRLRRNRTGRSAR